MAVGRWPAGRRRCRRSGLCTVVPGGSSPLQRRRGRCPFRILENAEPVRKAIEAAIATARALIAERIEVNLGGSTRDYAATVVGVWAEGESGCLFHIGDGAAAATRAKDLGRSVVSPPENGSFAEETFFFTDRAWRARLRITPFKDCDLVVLASDGAGSFTFAPRWQGLEAEFVAPLARHLERRSSAAARRTLARVLHAPGARAISGDDKTLILARLRDRG